MHTKENKNPPKLKCSTIKPTVKPKKNPRIPIVISIKGKPQKNIQKTR